MMNDNFEIVTALSQNENNLVDAIRKGDLDEFKKILLSGLNINFYCYISHKSKTYTYMVGGLIIAYCPENLKIPFLKECLNHSYGKSISDVSGAIGAINDKAFKFLITHGWQNNINNSNITLLIKLAVLVCNSVMSNELLKISFNNLDSLCQLAIDNKLYNALILDGFEDKTIESFANRMKMKARNFQKIYKAISTLLQKKPDKKASLPKTPKYSSPAQQKNHEDSTPPLSKHIVDFFKSLKENKIIDDSSMDTNKTDFFLNASHQYYSELLNFLYAQGNQSKIMTCDNSHHKKINSFKLLHTASPEQISTLSISIDNLLKELREKTTRKQTQQQFISLTSSSSTTTRPENGHQYAAIDKPKKLKTRPNQSNAEIVLVIDPIEENKNELENNLSEPVVQSNEPIWRQILSQSNQIPRKPLLNDLLFHAKKITPLQASSDRIFSLMIKLNQAVSNIETLTDNTQNIKKLSLRYLLLRLFHELDNWHAIYNTKNNVSNRLIKNNIDITSVTNDDLLELAKEINIVWNSCREKSDTPESILYDKIKNSSIHRNAVIDWKNSHSTFFTDYRKNNTIDLLNKIKYHLIQMQHIQHYALQDKCLLTPADLLEATLFCLYQIGLAYSLCPHLQMLVNLDPSLKPFSEIVNLLWDKSTQTVYSVDYWNSIGASNIVNEVIKKISDHDFLTFINTTLRNLEIPEENYYTVQNQFSSVVH
jgi:hypothetical protein